MAVKVGHGAPLSAVTLFLFPVKWEDFFLLLYFFLFMGKLTVLKWRGGLQSTPKAARVSPRRWQKTPQSLGQQDGSVRKSLQPSLMA